MNGSHNTYDAVPYDSYASRLTHISHLNLIGRLFGMRPADVDRCRVLELGGAGGGNLIPMAAEFPRSEFICVDLSAAQIGEGRRHASALGLANLRFETMSIMDFPRSEGAFDYFICHGVYSWVPAPVQDKIFALAREHLSPEGIAMVSYNALPGWNMIRSVRDLMQYHTTRITDTVDKTAKARAILNFINESLKAATGPWADTIRAETRMLARAPDYYLMHEHLEENNEPCYLHQFMERAAACELQYLGDAEAKAMYMGNLSPLDSETLAPLTDRVRSEQYMDFITNRRFRHTLLCRASVPLTTAISPAVIDGLYIRSALVAQTPARLDAGVAVAFTGPGNLNFSVTDTLTKVVLLALAESAALPMSVEEIIAKIVARNESIDADAARAVLKRHALHLFFAGGITLNARPPTYASRCPAKPVAFPVARYQASFRQLVTNGRHEMVTLSPIECVIIQLLDGTHTPESLVAPVSAQLAAQGLSLLRDGKAIANQAEMERELTAYCGKVLQTFAAQALLQA